ncbi:MAG: uncharacterized protein JWR45_2756 [Blastococcus sp.]|jgi:hypothetical protein|nr:uncharacterized protein [Blastococcus sp.]
MFAGQPQPVEIHHRGIWYSGELIGWRHGPGGQVAARVRCCVDGLRHSAWMDLANLRLPDPKRPPHKEPFPAAVRRSTLAGPDEDDATRPHALLAGMRTRPAKPVHATTPPPSRRSADPLAAETPRTGTPSAGPLDLPRRPEPAARERRRLDRRTLEDREAWLSAV